LPLLGSIILFTAVGGIASAAFAGLFLLLPEKTGLRMLPHFVSFATGALIGAALLGLLPEAMQSVGPGGAHAIGVALVAGLGVFFIIEKLVLWRHAHSHEHEDPTEGEVSSRGVTDSLPDDEAAKGHGARVVTAERTHSVAFAGDVGRQAAALGESGALAQSHAVATASQGARGRNHEQSHGGHRQDPGRYEHGWGGPGHEPRHGRAEQEHGEGHSEYGRSDNGHGRGQSERGQGDSEHGRGQSERGQGDSGHGRGHSEPGHADRGHGHDHGGHGHDHGREGAAGVLVLIGDSIHNALDGILIAAAFLTSVPLGLVTTLAVAAHEIPHRVGDFALLLHAGMSRQRAMFLNMATGLASVLGGIVAYFGLSKAQGALPYALALAAAGFLYIAVAGLIPGLHRRADPRTSLAQVLLMGLGVGVIAWAESLTG
jgi:zinc transporter ZupT